MNEEVVDFVEGICFFKEQLCGLLDVLIQVSGVFFLVFEWDCFNIWLMVGVNGVGKIIIFGKFVNFVVCSGYLVLIVVVDIFWVVVVQQVEVWGECSDVLVVFNFSSNVDFVVVVFDVIGVVCLCKFDLLLVDIVGCLQIKYNLMEEF